MSPFEAAYDVLMTSEADPFESAYDALESEIQDPFEEAYESLSDSAPVSAVQPGAVEGVPAALSQRRESHPLDVDEFLDDIASGNLGANVAHASDGSPIALAEQQLQDELAAEGERKPLRDVARDIGQAVKEVPKGLARGIQQAEGAVGSAIEMGGDWIDAQQRQWKNLFYESPIGQRILEKRKQDYIKEHGFREWSEDKLSATPESVGQKVSDFGRDVHDFWNEAAATGWEKRDPKIYEGEFIENPSVARVVGGVSESAPTMLMAMGLSAAGQPGAGAVLLAGSESLPVYTEAKRMGASEQDAFSYALLTGIGTAALERVGLDAIMGKNPMVDKLVQKMGAKWYAGVLAACRT